MLEEIDTKLDTLIDRASRLDQTISSILLQRSRNGEMVFNNFVYIDYNEDGKERSAKRPLLEKTDSDLRSDEMLSTQFRWSQSSRILERIQKHYSNEEMMMEEITEDGNVRSGKRPRMTNTENRSLLSTSIMRRLNYLIKMLNRMELSINQNQIDHTSNDEMAPSTSTSQSSGLLKHLNSIRDDMKTLRYCSIPLQMTDHFKNEMVTGNVPNLSNIVNSNVSSSHADETNTPKYSYNGTTSMD